MATEVVHGYYRYSDIVYEWHKTIESANDRGALKAFLHPNSMTDNQNPLSKEGVCGVELYMGTMKSGESRLLFSSGQVEYIRYWLHAVGLTPSPIPLPSSHVLLLKSDLRAISPVTYDSPSVLKKALNVITKNNKRLHGAIGGSLADLRKQFEKVRAAWAMKRGVWCAVDFEGWEMDHKLITEFGWSAMRWREDGTMGDAENGHLTVRGTSENFKYVQGNRRHFLFGKSIELSSAAFKKQVTALLTSYLTPPTPGGSPPPLFLIFHDRSQDLEYLASLGFPHTPQFPLPENISEGPPTTGVFAVDTSDLFAALEGESSVDRRSLGRMAALLKVEGIDRLHNAGNDAHFTFEALKTMASGPPLDLQREQRWPGRTEPTEPGVRAPPTVKVKFTPYEEDSDYSDTDGML
ncbi:hypothetical protein BOTBODRAFT_34216 [Botryobasidium botryosum FD-172 SS1]|uniref:Gfd2/YDR514C-like C-terminal domain-containing protein n=1 Tax=Botryobasidium botryosum (strain FD-172 SS1) TaxID=930990 RepID=A0A067MAH1_BOTB1|nr:hypothetical protein BOTBODRAFT_34216 [Botryobasidium botryosum FD-172 SS1]